MTSDRKAALYHDARTFTAGAACGFLGGALAVAVMVWQFGLGPRQPARSGASPAANMPRAEDALDDAGSGVVEAEPDRVAPTTGRATPPNASSDSASTSPPPNASSPVGEASELSGRDLEMPVEGVRPDQLTRQFNDERGGTRRHEALDILAPRNTPVRAVENGRIARLFNSKAGGITIYQFDPSERYCYYYAHLERYAEGLREGQQVTRGQVIGFVGTSGNAPKNTPHLHFAVFRLTADKHWWEGTPIDPYDILR